MNGMRHAMKMIPILLLAFGFTAALAGPDGKIYWTGKNKISGKNTEAEVPPIVLATLRASRLSLDTLQMRT